MAEKIQFKIVEEEEKPKFRVVEEKKEGEEELKISMGMPKVAGKSWQERFENILNDVVERIERLENSYRRLADDVESLRDNVSEIETNIHELTALYDALSAQFNPFIDLTPQQRRVISGEASVESEEEIEELTEEEEEELPEAEELEEIPQELEEITEEKKEIKPERRYILADIPDNSQSHMMAIKWTEFMLEKVGPSNIRKLLEYYRNLRWISDRVVSKIMHQVKGFDTEKIEPEYDDWRMSTDDHMKTLVFLEKIKGGDIGSLHMEEVQEVAEDIKRG